MSEDCGHNHDEEIRPEVQPVLDAMGEVITTLNNVEIVFAFRQIIADMFVRVHPDDDFLSLWDDFDNDVRTMFDPVNSPQPDILAEYQASREEYAREVASEPSLPSNTPMTEEEGMFELNSILGEHGVLGEDEVYGNYL